MMQRSAAPLLRSLRSSRNFSSTPDNIVFSVLFERLPVVIPKIDPVVYAFQEFSLRWQQQYRRKYPDEVLSKADASDSFSSRKYLGPTNLASESVRIMSG